MKMSIVSVRAATHKVIIDQTYCKPEMCQICAGMCPKDNLIYDGYRIIDLDRCNGCMVCEKYCPDMAIKIVKKSDEEDIVAGE